MSLLKAYLAKPSTQRALNRKPGEQGFSLIELVVVVAVLAILAAIAIPSFTSINQEARVAGAKTTLANIAKECAVKLVGSGADLTYIFPTVANYVITVTAPGAEGTCAATDEYVATSADNTLPTFTYNAANGAKPCTAGTGGGTDVMLGCTPGDGTPTVGTW